ncbi:hypothetical protein E1J38_002550 [Seonamhaeicola sediminis]|uniref:Uncharacterized protein n=1 Tax=Seonamhaeicola sediminis TaxID=2528206 RepID=A0A562YJ06_9FLAO|nr:hypothetical protein [Seonamhaeicola sediminis]TWO34758.1 hypothetical protein E1J38_002550 [Seonamhaeicola sediminis]
MKKTHSFHIPVMGIGFTIDSPFKVAQYGIDSVISLVDDILLEKLRKMYCEKFEMPYTEITNKVNDFRSKRITSYLNLMNDLVDRKFESLKNYSSEKVDDIKAYLNMLPNGNKLKEDFTKLTKKGLNTHEIKNWVFKNLNKGSIDVNIMTKVDKENYFKNEKLPAEYNDAHAALRGFAKSNLNAAVILSAGLNPKLYTYMSQFDDFYPDENGQFKKRIILKVSDYRSALIQGKFLAKKGLWVSEYRIESGLNCGGHAFATDGFLMGPVLAEFKKNREPLRSTIQELLSKSLESTNRLIPSKPLKLEISAQGGVGTHEEHEFLIREYALDSVGWGSPFLLVPEATTVDDETLKKLAKAKEDDLYLSNISPLGVPFNNLKHNTKDSEKEYFITKGKPGSSCPKKFVALNKEFTEKGVCTASRKYQNLKIKEVQSKNLSSKEYQIQLNKITEKSCTCVGLGTSALLAYGLDTKVEGKGVSVCPGPNMAYYSNVMSLKNITDHIYGRDNMISRTSRPHMFIKELNIYTDFLKNKFENIKQSFNLKEVKYLQTFSNNMQLGIAYYKELFSNVTNLFEDIKVSALKELERNEAAIKQIQTGINSLSLV